MHKLILNLSNPQADHEYFNRWLKENYNVESISYYENKVTITFSVQQSAQNENDISEFYGSLTSEDLNPDHAYEIYYDVNSHILEKDVTDIEYKKELKNGSGYTSVHTIHQEGEFSGMLEKTEYYRGYVDDNNRGDLVLVVEEVYTIDNSDDLIPFSARPALTQTKTWRHVNMYTKLPEVTGKGVKVITKVYNTRRKQHKEGIKRRDNIEEQLIDNIGLAGILSGAFTGSNQLEQQSDVFNKLTNLQKTYNDSFSAWKNSGRGSLYSDIENDSQFSWLDLTVPDNQTTQELIPWIIGLTLKDYIVKKLKGEIK